MLGLVNNFEGWGDLLGLRETVGYCGRHLTAAIQFRSCGKVNVLVDSRYPSHWKAAYCAFFAASLGIVLRQSRNR